MIKRFIFLIACATISVTAVSSFAADGGHAPARKAAPNGGNPSHSEVTSAQDNAHTGAEQFRTKEEEVRVSMINMSRQLSVTCTTCHNQKISRPTKSPHSRRPRSTCA